MQLSHETPAEQKRRYQREYARRRRREHWTSAARASRVCPHRHGPGRCGALLVERTDGNGSLVIECPRCTRRLRGICRDCPRPVEGRIGSAVRCRECKEVARRAQVRASQERNRDAINRRARKRLREQAPEKRQEREAYKKAYRQAHPERVRAWKRREALKQHARHLEYHRRYNEGRRAEKAALARDRYYAETPVPTPTCRVCARSIPWNARGQGGRSGRPPARCVFCDAQTNLAALRQAIRRWVKADERPSPVRVAAPVRPLFPARRYPTRLNDRGERLCCVSNCDRVVRSREKKCARCKQLARAAANVLLARGA